MKRHFQAWLREHYANDLAALQATWADAYITFETAAVPSHAEQSRTLTGHSFRDPVREPKTIDFYTCFAQLRADNLLEFCHTVRQLTGGEKLVGAFFGYLMELAWNMDFFADSV